MKQQQEKSRSPFAKAIRNFFKSGVATAGAVILTLVVLMAIFADVGVMILAVMNATRALTIHN